MVKFDHKRPSWLCAHLIGLEQDYVKFPNFLCVFNHVRRPFNRISCVCVLIWLCPRNSERKKVQKYFKNLGDWPLGSELGDKAWKCGQPKSDLDLNFEDRACQKGEEWERVAHQKSFRVSYLSLGSWHENITWGENQCLDGHWIMQESYISVYYLLKPNLFVFLRMIFFLECSQHLI